jgi:RNA polymerase sigma factor (sigma-70 family)
MTESEEAALIASLRAKDRTAMADLIRAVGRQLHAWAAQRLSGALAGDVPDAVQEALIAFWRYSAAGKLPDTVQSVGDIMRLLHCFVRRRALDVVQRAEQRLTHAQLDETAVTDTRTAAPDRVAEVHENAELVRALLADLSPEQREATELQLNGLTPKEIADRLGVPISTVSSRLRRARRALGDLLAPRFGEEASADVPPVENKND